MDLTKSVLPSTLVLKLNLIAKSSRFIKRYLNGDESAAIAQVLFGPLPMESNWFMWGDRQCVVQVSKGERPCIFAL